MRKKSWPINASLSKFLFFFLNKNKFGAAEWNWRRLVPMKPNIFRGLSHTHMCLAFVSSFLVPIIKWMNQCASSVCSCSCVCVCVCVPCNKTKKQVVRPTAGFSRCPPAAAIQNHRLRGKFFLFFQPIHQNLAWLRSHFYRMFWLIFPFFNNFLSQFLRIFGR